MGKRYTDENGFLHLPETPISRVQCAPYLGRQIDAKGVLKDEDGKKLLNPDDIYYVYRSEDELFKPEVMKGFEGMPFRVGHQMLGNGGKNVKKVDNTPIDGTFTNVHRSEDNPDFLVADIIVYTDRAKNAIANGTKELSLGYRCAYVHDEGSFRGKKYQFRQTNIKANHLALVPHGRAGSSVCVQDEAIVDDFGLVITCDSLPEEIQIMEENEKKAKDKLTALLKGTEENVQDCLDYCDLTAEQKKAIKAMKAKSADGEAKDAAPKCKGCGKDEIPAPVPPPAEAVGEKKEEVKETEAVPEKAEEVQPKEAAVAPAKAEEQPAETPVAKPAPVQDAACPKCGTTFTQDELDEACKKAAKAARKDAIRAKMLADAVGEDVAIDETEGQVAKKACKKIKGLEQYANDECPDGEAIAAIRGHIAKQIEDDDDAEKAKSEAEDCKCKAAQKKKIVTVAQDEGIAKTRASFSADEFSKYLGAH